MAEGATGGSLADRISKPDLEKTSWADEVNSPSTADPPQEVAKEAPKDEKEEPKKVPQMDGAAEPFNGSELQEPDYQVEIKLADMQLDPNNPLFSVTTFEELGL